MEIITNIDQNISDSRIKIRVGLIIAGIVTAVICVMAFLYEVRSVDKQAVNLIPASNAAPANIIGKVMNEIIAFSIPF